MRPIWDLDVTWQFEARCRGSDANLFFSPTHLESKEERHLREAQAKSICSTCTPSPRSSTTGATKAGSSSRSTSRATSRAPSRSSSARRPDVATPEARLAELGITLPEPPAAVAAYVPALVHGGLVWVSGQ